MVIVCRCDSVFDWCFGAAGVKQLSVCRPASHCRRSNTGTLKPTVLCKTGLPRRAAGFASGYYCQAAHLQYETWTVSAVWEGLWSPAWHLPEKKNKNLLSSADAGPLAWTVLAGEPVAIAGFFYQLAESPAVTLVHLFSTQCFMKIFLRQYIVWEDLV